MRRRTFEPARGTEPGFDRVALVDRLADQIAEREVGDGANGVLQRAAGFALRTIRGVEENLVRHFFEKLCVLRLVQHGKTRGDIGLEREKMENVAYKTHGWSAP